MNKQIFWVMLSIVTLMVGVTGVGAQTDNDLSEGVFVDCEDGGSFDNGVQVDVIQMRTGSTYRITAIGIDNFDPVLAVFTGDNDGVCSDDDTTAAEYSAFLPTTGEVDTNRFSSQVLFTNSGTGAFADVSIVVGGHQSMSGEFLLVVEDMFASEADGLGDPFSVLINDPLIDSGVPLTAYQVAVTNAFDPAIALIDSEYNILEDENKVPLICDDAGNDNLCASRSTSMNNAFITRDQNGSLTQLPGGPLDAMYTIPLDEELSGTYINMVMTTVQNTFGDYIVVFHMGTSETEIEPDA